ncbi:helix-turn-helix transcriptional regulator [Glycomyces algeriensis]|uniref:Transcriptional regulator n=1 Tax=Glycomyces algeriensis TaxID=256037 RepID=A0A9W6G5Y9_9ACTN|nr:AAA family ATPase [Glycomyces algeriensis]MDA1368470.1 AAA family ATPase [Glycomyces algeriensis]MDR7353277.1 DNA-binding CsgD family transcriptional regulator [Glycomyces algeriensis]GLI40972.1 transcriptional regulator [Glycomyces algeriensis]
MLYGRDAETAALADRLTAAREGRGSALVVRGEAGIGKSSLVAAAAESAADLTVLRCTGVESEHAWSFAGLQALLLPLSGHLEAIPEHHACVLARVLGIAAVPEKDAPPGDLRFTVGLAALSLLTEASGHRPVLCVVEDAHWLDPDSADVLLFIAKRLAAESALMLFTVREGYAPEFPAPGLDELRLGPLDDEAAAALLAERLGTHGYTDRGQLLHAAEGNPLALLELPLVESEARLAADWTGRRSTTSRLKQVFGDRIDRLPEATRTLLLVISADDSADTGLVIEVAGKLGAQLTDLAPAEADELVHFHGDRFSFGHPLIRSAAYQGAPLFRRIEAHRVYADVMGPGDYRRVFHLAAAATGPDENVAAALEASAECGSSCGGHGYEYTVFERAAAFTPDPHVRGRRLLRAAEAAVAAGNGSKARVFASQIGRFTDDRAILARATLMAAMVAAWDNDIREAYRLYMEAADHYVAADITSTGYPLFRAVELAWQAGDFSRAEVAAEYAERLGIDHAPWVRDLAKATAGLNRSCTVTVAEAVDSLRHLIEIHTGFGESVTPENRAMVAWWQTLIGDIDAAEQTASGTVSAARTSGAAGALPRALTLNALTEFYRGRWKDAEALAWNGVELSIELGQRIGPVKARAHVLAPIAALRGDEERVRELVEAAYAGSPGDTVVAIDNALALLDFSVGRNEEALDRLMARLESNAPGEVLALVPVAVEAAVRAGEPERIADAFDWFTQWAEASGQPHLKAQVERCRGLLAAEPEAGAHYERAAELHKMDDAFPFETARTDLILGEWLRRARRVNEAKSRLRTAAGVFERLGAEPWSERVRRELRAAGDAGPIEAAPDLANKLTAQELQVVRLAAAGLSNREIGEQLFLSPRTAGYHLYKAYPKLGVASRNDLARLGL